MMIHSYSTMILIMLFSGLFSSMYIWSDKFSDIRLSINDAYMIGLMTSWMILFMSILNKDKPILIISSLIAIIVFLVLIRKQTFVSLNQFYTGMIPHHSMALLMSKKLLEKGSKNITDSDKLFIKGIIDTQEKEIDWMKKRLN
jgi:hypothetical protein